MTNIDTIREHLGQEELLVQLAEEAAELGKAALKLRRTYSDINPTPIGSQEAFANLMEELADVYTCLHILGYGTCENLMQVHQIAVAKQARWARRLEEAHKNR